MPEFHPEHVDDIDDSFVRGYLSCAEWLATSDSPSGELTDSQRSRIRGFTRRSIATAKRDCKAFVKQAGKLLDDYQDATGRDMESAGMDFWLTRNRHGSGFWDRGNAPCLRALTHLAHGFGESNCEAYRNRLHLI